MTERKDECERLADERCETSGIGWHAPDTQIG